MTSSNSWPSRANCSGGVPPASATRSAPEQDLVHDAIVDGGEELLFGPDVVVEGAFPELVGLTELDRARGVIPTLGEDVRRQIDDGLAPHVPFRATPGVGFILWHL